MKVLLLAEQCNPEWPSLPIVGYKASLEISALVDVVVVTHIRNKENIDKVGLGKAEVIFIDNEYIAKYICKLAKFVRGKKGGWTTSMAFNYPSYLAFEWEVLQALRGRIDAGEFDVIHRLTPMSPTLPSMIASKVNVPFVLGPLNGGLKWPKQFLGEMCKEREWLSPIRKIYKILPYSRSTFKSAAAILAGFDHTIQDLPSSMTDKVINFPEVGIDPLLFNSLGEREESAKKTILFASRLVPYKLPDVVIDAFINSPELQKHRLLIVGDGPLREEMETKVKKHNLSDVVIFLGWKTQIEVSQYMRTSDIFAYPTIRELGAGALVEAMACKMACIVVDYGASASLIDAQRGVKLALQDKRGITRELTTQLELLVNNPKRINDLSERAYEHVMRYYSWAEKARKTVGVYRWVLGKAEKPSFWDR
jgi:glycosyltransferase involved in cell wall biosynthesis